MKPIWILGLGLFLATIGGRIGRAVETPAPRIDRPGLQWFNVAQALSLDDLRGRVVLLDFWTEGCINCIHIIPTLRRIEERFAGKVVVIGVHSPKFANERDAASVEDAIVRYEIHHPIVHDPEMTIWHDYSVQAWPTVVVIGTDGIVVGQISGEPDPDKLITALEGLLDRSQRAGTLKPALLALTPVQPPATRFLFPGKLKPLPPRAVAGAATAGKEWVLADSGHHQIVVLSDSGADVRRYGSGQQGHADGPAEQASFNRPQGLVATADAIFVADTDNHAIRRIDRASGVVTTLAGTGKRGRTLETVTKGRETALASPWDLEILGERLFFANAGTHQIGVLNLRTGTVGRFAGSGEEALTQGSATQSAFAQPSGLTLSADHRILYVADSESSAIRAISIDPAAPERAPKVRDVVGAGLFDFGWINGPLHTARLQHPLGVATDGPNLLVADTYNSAIRQIDLPAGQVADFDGGKFTCMDPICIPTREPAGIIADGPDRILLVDTGNQRIEEYRPSTKGYHTWAR